MKRAILAALFATSLSVVAIADEDVNVIPLPEAEALEVTNTADTGVITSKIASLKVWFNSFGSDEEVVEINAVDQAMGELEVHAEEVQAVEEVVEAPVAEVTTLPSGDCQYTRGESFVPAALSLETFVACEKLVIAKMYVST